MTGKVFANYKIVFVCPLWIMGNIINQISNHSQPSVYADAGMNRNILEGDMKWLNECQLSRRY